MRCKPLTDPMNARTDRAGQEQHSARLSGWLGLGDGPADHEGLRLRKRVGIIAGYATVLAPLTLPIVSGGSTISFALAIGLAGFAVANLVFLARNRDFERYVVALILGGCVFVPAATFALGGVTSPGGGLVWGFLIPAYAILALGPRASVKWFGVYLGLVLLMVVVDPIAHALSPDAPYPLRLMGTVVNTVVPLSIVYALLRYTDIRRLAAEARVEELLTNAIPPSIAARLRQGEQRIAEVYPATSVVFADIVGFTPFAQQTPPEEVVALLDGLFTTFDGLAERHGLEKIKTSGDAYMAVVRAPSARDDHAAAAVALGRAMVEAVAAVQARRGRRLAVRVGVASGRVVGGVIGERRLQFDLWGDTVNLASRLESSGLPGRIQISDSTRALLPEDEAVEPRVVDLKGIGTVTAYLLR